jgi:hypothetical protein
VVVVVADIADCMDYIVVVVHMLVAEMSQS